MTAWHEGTAWHESMACLQPPPSLEEAILVRWCQGHVRVTTVGTRPSSRSDNTSDRRHQWLWPAHPLGFIFIGKIYRFNTRDRVA